MRTAQQEVIEILGLDGNRKSSSWLWMIPTVAAGIVLFVLFRSTSAERADQYVTQQPQVGDLQITVTATGTLQPTRQVEIGSEVSGIISELLVDFNHNVKAGQVLARLDTQQLETRVASAKAALAVAQALLSDAKATLFEADAKLNRSKNLFKVNAVSQQELESHEAVALRADASLKSAKAQVGLANASLKEALTTISKAEIKSPVDGIVISRKIDKGQTVAATFQTPILFVVAENLSNMKLHLDIDESDIGLVKEGQQALFRVDAYPDKEFSAEINSVRFYPREVNNIVTYEAVLSVSNSEQLLRPGMTATADIQIENKKNVFLVPNRSLRFLVREDETLHSALEGENVWILQNGKPQPVAVETGLSDGEFTEILGGEITSETLLIVDIVRDPESQSGGGLFD